MVLCEMHLDHTHEINCTIVHNMAEQLIPQKKKKNNKMDQSEKKKKNRESLPLSVSIRRQARISERGEPNEKNSLTSNANIKPQFSCLARKLSPTRDLIERFIQEEYYFDLTYYHQCRNYHLLSYVLYLIDLLIVLSYCHYYHFEFV